MKFTLEIQAKYLNVNEDSKNAIIREKNENFSCNKTKISEHNISEPVRKKITSSENEFSVRILNSQNKMNYLRR